MQFSQAIFLITAAAFTGALAHPSGFTTKVIAEPTPDRQTQDGTVVSESAITASQLEDFKSLPGHSERRDTEVLAQRNCLLGMTCASDQDCWFNGCTGCIFFSANGGICY